MSIDQLKRMAVFFLKQYKAAWKENAAHRSMLASVPMVDGTKGIPGWEKILAEYLADEETEKVAQKRFAPIFARIEQVHLESELLELLQRFPPVGGVQ